MPEDDYHYLMEIPGVNVPLDHKRVKFNVKPTYLKDHGNGYFSEEYEPEPSRASRWRDLMNGGRNSSQQVPFYFNYPVLPARQVPVPVPVPAPIMYMPPVYPCNCPCCLNGCPGPGAHHVVYGNKKKELTDSSECTCKCKDHSSSNSSEKNSTREELNRILRAKAPSHYNRSGPLIDVSEEQMAYIYDRYDRKKLDELATEPPLQQMKITHKDLPWEINIRSKDSRGITVRDVLDTIYSELNVPVSEEAANKMRGHWLVMRYRDRTSDARKTGDRYAGLKRMHWMRLENHNLVGLEPHKTDKWLMVFEKPEEK